MSRCRRVLFRYTQTFCITLRGACTSHDIVTMEFGQLARALMLCSQMNTSDRSLAMVTTDIATDKLERVHDRRPKLSSQDKEA